MNPKLANSPPIVRQVFTAFPFKTRLVSTSRWGGPLVQLRPQKVSLVHSSVRCPEERRPSTANMQSPKQKYDSAKDSPCKHTFTHWSVRPFVSVSMCSF
jgi:hypothetical protein